MHNFLGWRTSFLGMGVTLREGFGIVLGLAFLIASTLACCITLISGEGMGELGPLKPLINMLVDVVGAAWAGFAQFALGGFLCAASMFWGFRKPSSTPKST